MSAWGPLAVGSAVPGPLHSSVRFLLGGWGGWPEGGCSATLESAAADFFPPSSLNGMSGGGEQVLVQKDSWALECGETGVARLWALPPRKLPALPASLGLCCSFSQQGQESPRGAYSARNGTECSCRITAALGVALGQEKGGGMSGSQCCPRWVMPEGLGPPGTALCTRHGNSHSPKVLMQH